MTITHLIRPKAAAVPTIRAVCSADERAVTSLSRSLHPAHHSHIERYFQLSCDLQARHIFLVAEVESRLIGYVFASPRVLPASGRTPGRWDHNTAVLRQLAILPSYRASRVPADLLDRAVSEASALWYSQVIAHVSDTDADLYTRGGWALSRPGCGWLWLERSRDLDSSRIDRTELTLMTESPETPRGVLGRLELARGEYLAIQHRLDSPGARTSALHALADAYENGEGPAWLTEMVGDRELLDAQGALAHLTARRPYAVTHSRVA